MQSACHLVGWEPTIGSRVLGRIEESRIRQLHTGILAGGSSLRYRLLWRRDLLAGVWIPNQVDLACNGIVLAQDPPCVSDPVGRLELEESIHPGKQDRNEGQSNEELAGLMTFGDAR